MRFKSLVLCGTLLLSGQLYSDVPTYKWKVLEVYDGDTFTVDKKFYPVELGNIRIRVKGIDTGESGWRAKCNKEAKAASDAKIFGEIFLKGKTVSVTNIDSDKYGQRIVADVYVDGVKYADELLKRGLAKPYDGTKKEDWCL